MRNKILTTLFLLAVFLGNVADILRVEPSVGSTFVAYSIPIKT